MTALRIFVIAAVSIFYAAFVIVSFSLKLDFLLFCLAIPWGIIVAIVSAAFHANSDNSYWLLAGAFFNLIFFQWISLLKPMLEKSWEVKE